MTTIKITQLTDIGANLATSTVLPVVNMAGTPTTQKTTVGNIANLALSQAGNSYPAAAQAVLAQTVTNAAQPNITSTGTLTSLAVTGNISAGNVSATLVTGTLATAAQPNITSTGTLTGLTVSDNASINGNITSNGTAYLGNISTTGSASITTLSVGATANLGAVGNITITGGTAGQVLSTNGNGVLSWASDATTYGNSNVAAYLPTYTGNIGGNVVTANLFSGNGSSLSAIAGANVSGFVPNANVANTAFAVAAANVSGLGNIATINLTGSTSNVLYGNGVFAVVAAPTVTQDITSNGAMSIMTYDGNLKYVNYATVEPSTGNITGGNLITAGISKTGVFVTGNIPTAAIAGAGARAFVTDATLATFGSAYVGGAANAVPVWSDGSAWYIG